MTLRAPAPALRSVVDAIWCSERRVARGDRERVLPTGAMHIAIRLAGPPVRIYAGATDACGERLGHAVAGGARAAAYLRDVAPGTRTIGAQLRPGAALRLFGVPAERLSGRHTPLEVLWGPWAGELRDRLAALPGREDPLALFETLLASRLRMGCELHPAVAHALRRFRTTHDVGAVVAETGISHRRFIALFRQDVGLAPKLYCRVSRFQDAVLRLAARPPAGLAAVACDAGYSDQPHMGREFRDLAGLAPGAYRRAARRAPHHVLLQPERRSVNSIQDGPSRRE
jgi:AraC-like DNA-binding protein